MVYIAFFGHVIGINMSPFPNFHNNFINFFFVIRPILLGVSFPSRSKTVKSFFISLSRIWPLLLLFILLLIVKLQHIYAELSFILTCIILRLNKGMFSTLPLPYFSFGMALHRCESHTWDIWHWSHPGKPPIFLWPPDICRLLLKIDTFLFLGDDGIYRRLMRTLDREASKDTLGGGFKSENQDVKDYTKGYCISGHQTE